MKTINTIIAENIYNQDAIEEIRNVSHQIATAKGLNVIVNHNGANFWTNNQNDEDLVLEAKDKIMIELISMGY